MHAAITAGGSWVSVDLVWSQTGKAEFSRLQNSGGVWSRQGRTHKAYLLHLVCKKIMAGSDVKRGLFPPKTQEIKPIISSIFGCHSRAYWRGNVFAVLRLKGGNDQVQVLDDPNIYTSVPRPAKTTFSAKKKHKNHKTTFSAKKQNIELTKRDQQCRRPKSWWETANFRQNPWKRSYIFGIQSLQTNINWLTLGECGNWPAGLSRHHSSLQHEKLYKIASNWPKYWPKE